jgi:hypothetical protein
LKDEDDDKNLRGTCFSDNRICRHLVAFGAHADCLWKQRSARESGNSRSGLWLCDHALGRRSRFRISSHSQDARGRGRQHRPTQQILSLCFFVSRFLDGDLRLSNCLRADMEVHWSGAVAGLTAIALENGFCCTIILGSLMGGSQDAKTDDKKNLEGSASRDILIDPPSS